MKKRRISGSSCQTISKLLLIGIVALIILQLVIYNTQLIIANIKVTQVKLDQKVAQIQSTYSSEIASLEQKDTADKLSQVNEEHYKEFLAEVQRLNENIEELNKNLEKKADNLGR